MKEQAPQKLRRRFPTASRPIAIRCRAICIFMKTFYGSGRYDPLHPSNTLAYVIHQSDPINGTRFPNFKVFVQPIVYMTLVAEHLVAFQVITVSPLVIFRYHLHLTKEINFKKIILNSRIFVTVEYN